MQEAEYGWGSYNPFEDDYPPGLDLSALSDVKHSGVTVPAKSQPYNLKRASLRDTVQIPSRGYAVLRFRADNPGVWLFHCHILWHLATGMAMLIDVQGDNDGHFLHDPSLFTAAGGGGCTI